MDRSGRQSRRTAEVAAEMSDEHAGLMAGYVAEIERINRDRTHLVRTIEAKTAHIERLRELLATVLPYAASAKTWHSTERKKILDDVRSALE